MTRTQEQILARLSIAISLVAIGVSLHTEHTLDALEAMRSASRLGNSESDPMRATVPGSLTILPGYAMAGTDTAAGYWDFQASGDSAYIANLSAAVRDAEAAGDSAFMRWLRGDDDVIHGSLVETVYYSMPCTTRIDASSAGFFIDFDIDGAWLIRNVADNDTVWTIGGRQVWPEK